MPRYRFVMVAAICVVAIVGWIATNWSLRRGPFRIGNPPAWAEIRWPFPPDPFGPGLAFRCEVVHCGSQIDLYLRAKIGFCGCVESIDDDLVERMSDIQLLGRELVAIGSGRTIAVHRMQGRSRSYVSRATDLPVRTALAVAFHDRCDMVGATAFIEGDEPHTHEDAVLAFLNSDRVLHWAEKTLGL